MATQDEWEAIWQAQRSGRRPRVWTKRVCPLCSQTISEGMGSGQSGNFRRHVEACEKKRASEPPT
jgi:hypothetical protein